MWRIYSNLSDSKQKLAAKLLGKRWLQAEVRG
jgi:hypothetical protein